MQRSYVPYGVIRTVRNAGLVLFLCAGSAFANSTTIAAFGDSLTQGFGLSPDQGFVSQLEAWLTDQGAEVTLINAGVSGDTTAGGLSRIEWTLTPDVDTILVALGGNDMLRGMDPAASRANLDGILDIATSRNLQVLLIGIEGTTNYGADFKMAFDAIYSDLAEKYDVLLHPNFLNALTSIDNRASAMATYMQADGIHPNADGVALIVEDIGPVVLELISKHTN